LSPGRAAPLFATSAPTGARCWRARAA
jgi:hypothetical protein